MKRPVHLNINGEDLDLMVEPHRTLLEVLREDMALTGTKQGCDGGECGACTVLIDDVPVNACLTLAVLVEGKSVTTIEGLARGEKMHPLQTALHELGAIQCGFCTPGVILTAKALIDRNPSPTMEEIRRGLSGNLCRCTGYIKILEAVMETAVRMRGESQGVPVG